MKKKLLLFILCICVILFFSLFNKIKNLSSLREESKNLSCSLRIEERIVRGNSLYPLIKDGQKVRVLFGYYQCYPIKRGDIVLYHYTGNKDPLIKIVKAIPGDRFYLKKTKNGWYILVNGKILKNSENKPYLISGVKYKLLSLYEKDYRGIIPNDAYLLLGNLPHGSLDSTEFGLAGKEDILAKVEY